MTQPYVHSTDKHNLDAPRGIVPQLAELLQPTSVVDVGCGLGTFLHAFKECDVLDVLGVDGAWTDRALLAEHLAPRSSSSPT
jgi:2-polyprenyl-3-methyl-5-hydroxy-6-metoxy-1,4-benzoquinol methylase